MLLKFFFIVYCHHKCWRMVVDSSFDINVFIFFFDKIIIDNINFIHENCIDSHGLWSNEPIRLVQLSYQASILWIMIIARCFLVLHPSFITGVKSTHYRSITTQDDHSMGIHAIHLSALSLLLLNLMRIFRSTCLGSTEKTCSKSMNSLAFGHTNF